jgi:Peptidase_C39 like family
MHINITFGTRLLGGVSEFCTDCGLSVFKNALHRVELIVSLARCKEDGVRIHPQVYNFSDVSALTAMFPDGERIKVRAAQPTLAGIKEAIKKTVPLSTDDLSIHLQDQHSRVSPVSRIGKSSLSSPRRTFALRCRTSRGCEGGHARSHAAPQNATNCTQNRTGNLIMNRRSFVGLASAFAVAPVVHAQSCRFGLCRAEVKIPQLVAAIRTQECPEWCWAASISMIFNFYGHPIDQTEIVRQKYGNVQCLPAGSSSTIANALSRQWTDSNGNDFTSQIVAAYDPANGVVAINNSTIVRELSTNHPLLYCNTSHAMVNFSVDYFPSPGGPRVQSVGVVDPWPTNARTHALSDAERMPSSLYPGGQMTFLAAVRVQDV